MRCACHGSGQPVELFGEQLPGELGRLRPGRRRRRRSAHRPRTGAVVHVPVGVGGDQVGAPARAISCGVTVTRSAPRRTSARATRGLRRGLVLGQAEHPDRLRSGRLTTRATVHRAPASPPVAVMPRLRSGPAAGRDHDRRVVGRRDSAARPAPRPRPGRSAAAGGTHRRPAGQQQHDAEHRAGRAAGRRSSGSACSAGCPVAAIGGVEDAHVGGGLPGSRSDGWSTPVQAMIPVGRPTRVRCPGTADRRADGARPAGAAVRAAFACSAVSNWLRPAGRARPAGPGPGPRRRSSFAARWLSPGG